MEPVAPTTDTPDSSEYSFCELEDDRGAESDSSGVSRTQLYSELYVITLLLIILLLETLDLLFPVVIFL